VLAAGLLGCRSAEQPTARHIVIGQITSAVTLDPHGHDQAQTSITLSHFYESLVTFGSEMELKPLLAQRWESPSETVWRFHLRRGVRFHDGRPFGAEDAAASLRRAGRPDSHLRYYIQTIQDVRVIDDATLEVVTRHPAPVLLNKLVFVPIVPRDTGADPITRPVGTGPYRFVGGRPGASIVGQRFPDYWGASPAFEQVTLLPIPDARDRATAVAAGRADIVSQFPSQYWEEGLRQSNVKLVSRQGLSTVLLGFSLRAGSPFADPRLRQVVALAIDRDRIVRDALQRLGTPLDQIVPPSVAGYSSGLPLFRHDLDAARALLKQLHLPDRPIELLVADAHQEVGLEVALQLQELGLAVVPTTLPQKEFYERWSREEFPLSVIGWSTTTGDASGSYEPLLHSPVEGFGRFNRFAYSNPRLDQLIELSDQAQNPEDRREPLTAAARIVQEDLPILPLALRYDLYAGRKDLDWRPRLDRRIRAFEVRPVQNPAER